MTEGSTWRRNIDDRDCARCCIGSVGVGRLETVETGERGAIRTVEGISERRWNVCAGDEGDCAKRS